MNALEAHLAALAARFGQRASADRAALAQALAAGDFIAVRDIAHKLAGLAGMLGHPEVSEAALALETAAEDGRDLASPAAALDAMLEAVGSSAASSS